MYMYLCAQHIKALNSDCNVIVNLYEITCHSFFIPFHSNHIPDCADVLSDLFTLAHTKVFVWTKVRRKIVRVVAVYHHAM